jgi:hypothetical protein
MTYISQACWCCGYSVIEGVNFRCNPDKHPEHPCKLGHKSLHEKVTTLEIDPPTGHHKDRLVLARKEALEDAISQLQGARKEKEWWRDKEPIYTDSYAEIDQEIRVINECIDLIDNLIV